jgi:hypothetical protein
MGAGAQALQKKALACEFRWACLWRSQRFLLKINRN